MSEEHYHTQIRTGKHTIHISTNGMKLVEHRGEKETLRGYYSRFKSLVPIVGEDEALMKIINRIDKLVDKHLKSNYPIKVKSWTLTTKLADYDVHATRTGTRVNKETKEEYTTEVETCYYTTKKAALTAVANKTELEK